MSLPEPIILTRPASVNAEFAKLLREKLPDARIIELPLTEYVNQHPKLPNFDRYDAIIITSAQALRFSEPQNLDCVFYVVGNEAKKWLDARGAKRVECFENVKKLAHSLQNSQLEHLLYLRGEHVNLDLKTTLQNAGKSCDEIVIYRLEPRSVSVNEIKAITSLSAAVFPVFSYQSLERLLRKLRDWKYSGAIKILPISANLYDKAQSLRESGCEFKILPPSQAPNREAVILQIVEIYKNKMLNEK